MSRWLKYLLTRIKNECSTNFGSSTVATRSFNSFRYHFHFPHLTCITVHHTTSPLDRATCPTQSLGFNEGGFLFRKASCTPSHWITADVRLLHCQKFLTENPVTRISLTNVTQSPAMRCTSRSIYFLRIYLCQNTCFLTCSI